VVFFLALFAVWPVGAAAETAPSNRTLNDLITQAESAQLWDQRYWSLLVHYQASFSGGAESEVDDPGFFLALNGKTNPRAEMAATLAYWFKDDLVGRSQQPARCAFIARYAWLRKTLHISEQEIPIKFCDRFERWFAEFHAESVTLIFASAFMNNPSSMFGHTFLRVDQAGQTPQTRILASTINYAADVPPDAGIAFAFKGIAGLYHGYFSTLPYYMKVKEYRDLENRDIWEYRLNFSKVQIRKLLMHAWEMGNAYFDYFFFKENCAYHILGLLEMADPRLHLKEQFRFWTIPADTVRILTNQDGVVAEVTYRPSRSTKFIREREQLSFLESDWFHQIVNDPGQITTPAFRTISALEQARVLDLSSDYFRFKSMKDPDQAPELMADTQQVLLARSELILTPSAVPIRPFTLQPERGHGTSRLSVGVGWRDDEIFEEVALRAGYHDLLDPEGGYTPGAQIEVLGLHLRHYAKRAQFRVERFTLLDIVSLAPMDAFFHSPSWKFKIQQETVRFGTCRYCSSGNLNGGVGAAARWSGFGKPVFFGFGEIDANVSDAFQRNHRVGGGGTLGILASPHARWGILVSTTYLNFPLGDRSDDTRVFFSQRVTLAQNLSARMEYRHRDDDKELMFSLQAFF